MIMPPIFSDIVLLFPCMAHDTFRGRHTIGGSSITNGESSPFTRNLLKIRAIITANKMPAV